MALGFSPPCAASKSSILTAAVTKEEVMIMSDYEMLAIVLLIITLAFTIHIGNHHK